MAIVSPIYDTRAANGGFLDKIFQNLSKPFSADPKAQVALTLIPNGTPRYPYVSVKDQNLYFHTVPLDAPATGPLVMYDLTLNSLGDLATKIAAAGIGYTALVSGTQDGTSAALMLSFLNFTPSPADTVQLHTATSRLWKFLHPVANQLNEAGGFTDAGERMMYLPYALGFWIDYWGDWLNIPRLPGMTDNQYVSYIIWSMETPQVTNLAMSEVLSFRYSAPISVNDEAAFKFLISLDPSLMNTVTPTALAPVVNKIKSAGTGWDVGYVGGYKEDFKAFYNGRTGKNFESTDQLGLAMSFIEGRYGYETTGFMANSGLANDTTTGFGYKLKDEYLMTLQQNFTETKPKPTESGYAETITISQTETYTGTARDDLPSLSLAFTEGFRFRAPVGAFIFNQSPVNSTPIGGGDDNAVKEAAVMYYNNPSDPSYTVL